MISQQHAQTLNMNLSNLAITIKMLINLMQWTAQTDAHTNTFKKFASISIWNVCISYGPYE